MKYIKLYENFGDGGDEDLGFELENEEMGYDLLSGLSNGAEVLAFLETTFGTEKEPLEAQHTAKYPGQIHGGMRWVNAYGMPVISLCDIEEFTIVLRKNVFTEMKDLFTVRKLYYARNILKWYINMVYNLDITKIIPF